MPGHVLSSQASPNETLVSRLLYLAQLEHAGGRCIRITVEQIPQKLFISAASVLRVLFKGGNYSGRTLFSTECVECCQSYLHVRKLTYVELFWVHLSYSVGCSLLIVRSSAVIFYIVSHRKLQVRSFPALHRMKRKNRCHPRRQFLW